MRLYVSGVDTAIDSTFIDDYSRRKRKAGAGDREARAGMVERTKIRTVVEDSHRSDGGETSIMPR